MPEAASLSVLETPRLRLRRLSVDDAAFILELVNDPDWIRFIGDKGVKSLDDARRYLLDGPIAMYDHLGFGLYLTAKKDTGKPIGVCGPIKRETLEDVDVGFALLSQFRGQGYAFEATSAVLEHARQALGLRRVVAITRPENEGSIRVLQKVGFQFERELPPCNGEPLLCLFGLSGV